MASLLAFDAYATDWLNLLTRWLHVIAGIVWIGSSFYFIALDNHLRPPKDPHDADEGVGGETWEIHGGGFYNIKKYLVAPRVLPETLHWFKWEAYTTWLSGFALMIVLYYLNANTYLIDKSVADLSAGEAVAISVGLLAAAWIVYDVLCRLLAARPLVLAFVLLVLITHRGVGDWTSVQRARDVSPDRRDARDDDGRQCLLRDHPRALGAGACQAGRSGA